MAKSVRDAMTQDPRSIGASASVVEAARLMREQHIGSLPVTEDERLVGMITDRDITTRVVAEAADPKVTSVGEVYSRDLISVEPDKDLLSGRAQLGHRVSRTDVVAAQNAFAADFHSWRRSSMSWARSSSLPPSSTWRSEGSARR